ncbi:MAG TPA: PQQ-dependent sugar dehydrogenase [Chitinophagaceae bacterium]|nr:PQQ-dependent sugar dehydrogenase [Chitinophagaceae bacterium]
MKKRLPPLIVFLFFIASTYAQTCPGTGNINYQRWNNISGTAVSNLTSNSNYPNNPSSTGTLALFEMPINSGNNFGERLNGYICPPATGLYTFWIASDASAELWLSTTSSPANKMKIAYNTSETNSRQWNKYATQKSAAINLVAGQVYYVEALMKEGTGTDNLAVGWARPGQSTSAPSEVIPGTYLLTQPPDTQPPTAPTNLVSSAITQISFTLSWTASTDNVAVTGYDVYQNGIKINPSNIAGTSYNVTGLSPSTTYSYYVKAKDAAGNQSTASSTLNVTTASPDTEPPTSPTNLSAAAIAQTSFTLRWAPSTDNVAVTGYDVYKNNIKINPSNITNTSYDVTGLSSATTYAFTVIAKDAAGNQSVPSATLNVTTLTGGSASESFTMRTILANQRMPHDLVYGPDGNIWFTERFAGKVSFVNPVTSVKTTALTLGSAMVLAGGQDGLMGLALHPQFLTGKPYVYISYTYQSLSNTVRKTRIERYIYNPGTQLLESPVTILQDIPGSNDHNSARIAIGPDLKLYYSVGDMGAGQFDNINRPNNAQNLNIYEGKILRLNTELVGGSWIPADNPYSNGGQPTAVYSFGHRNAQGLVWGNVNGVNILYSDEHGPYSDDEINTIERGRNYGWPNVIGWCDGNYNGRTTGGYTIVNEQNNCTTLNAKEPLRSIFPSGNPPSGGDLMLWPTVAPSGADFYGSNAIPGWQNSLLITNLKKGTVARYKLSNDGQSILSDTIHYFAGLGRFRDVVISPDGMKIYVACDSSGSTSGPTGGTTTTPANPGSILEFTYQPPGGRMINNELFTVKKIVEDLNNKTIDVYPNPASTYIIIYNYRDITNRTIEMFDLHGRIMIRQKVMGTATRLETGSIPNGLYVLKVTDEKGRVLRVEKIVIQK